MGKRVTILILIILVSALAVMGYFMHQSRQSLFTEPYKTISPKACIVIETIDLQSFMNTITSGKGLFGAAEKIKSLDLLNQKLKYITDKLNTESFKKILSSGPSIISFYPSVDGNLLSLMSMPVPGEIRQRHLKEILSSSGIKNVIESKSNGESVLKIPFTVSGKSDTAYLSIISGLILLGNSLDIIKEAKLQAESNTDIRNLPGFSRVLLASGKKEDKIFIVFSNISKLAELILTDTAGDMSKKIARLAAIAEGDIYINEEGLVLSGYTESVDSTEFLFRYKDITPREFNTYKILPSSTVLFETLILPPYNKDNKHDSTITDEVIRHAGRLREYLGTEVTRAYIDIKEMPVSDNTLIIMALNNRVQAEQIFREEQGSGGDILYFQPDDQIKIPVYKNLFKGLTWELMSGYSTGSDDSFIAFYDNYLIAGSSFVTISRLLYDNLLNKTLANDLTYRDFEATIPSRAGYFFYCVPSKIIDYLAGFLSTEIIENLKLNRNTLNKIQAAGFQFASSNGMIYNSLSVRFKEEAREESTTEWETLLDTKAGIKPFIFTNHITGAKEIFIQDVKNNIYLINAAGRVLWKVALEEKITGSVYMIDYFKNGKYQLLFSGRNHIHLIDRNGNYVERYPVKLRSPATNSLALFDYDNNLTYRLFIAGEDRKVYSYDKSGSVVKGWKPFSTAGQVNADVVYFEVSGKDYLVVSDDISVYLLDRSGNIRVKLKEPVTKARGSAIRLAPGSKPFMVFSSPDGTVQQVYFDGSVRKISFRKFSVDHSFDFFDIDGDGFGEYVFIEKGILYLYDNNKAKLFEKEFNMSNLSGPINFVFSSSDRKIGVFDEDKELIYLIDKNGETMNGFPLRGASMFSIGKLSDKSGWHLIVGGTDRFLYNYKIETETK